MQEAYLYNENQVSRLTGRSLGQDISAEEAVDFVIRGCVKRDDCQPAAELIRHAYGLGVTGQSPSKSEFEAYAERRIKSNPMTEKPFRRLLALRDRAYLLGVRDSEILRGYEL